MPGCDARWEALQEKRAKTFQRIGPALIGMLCCYRQKAPVNVRIVRAFVSENNLLNAGLLVCRQLFINSEEVKDDANCLS
jgi:hypothetical protein